MFTQRAYSADKTPALQSTLAAPAVITHGIQMAGQQQVPGTTALHLPTHAELANSRPTDEACWPFLYNEQ